MTQKSTVQSMKKAVEFLKDNPWSRTPFFWLTFPSLGLLKPVQYLVLRELMDCDSVLDLGCGRHSMVPIISSRTKTVGVEFFKPHFEEAVRSGRHKEYLNLDITKADFPDKSFDAVILLDVIEHLSKEEGLSLLKKMERWARKKIIIFTPNGFLHQDGYDENPLMAHQSGWTAADMRGLGFKVFGVRGFKFLKKGDHHDHDQERPKIPMSESLVDLTQLFTYYWSGQAFQIFCVKNLESR